MMTRILLCAVLLMVGGAVWGQRPCRDTLVSVYDSICEGQTYDFNGRNVSYQGVFWDTLPRFSGSCDSVIVLHLAVLPYPIPTPSVLNSCHDSVGYHLYASNGNYFRWSSQPHDPALSDVGSVDYVFVSPTEPTLYKLYSDWRVAPQCPSEGSVRLGPITPVRAKMKLYLKDLVYDNMQIKVEDRSTGNKYASDGGWAGRNWYLNGERQAGNQTYEVFQVQPWMGDSVEVRLEAYNEKCADVETRVIPFLKGNIHFPNIFFPAQDVNNRFGPSTAGVTDYELKIYDRGGVLVYATTDEGDGWDGSHNGRPCKSGTYVYHCRYTTTEVPFGVQEQVGTVTLVR